MSVGRLSPAQRNAIQAAYMTQHQHRQEEKRLVRVVRGRAQRRRGGQSTVVFVVFQVSVPRVLRRFQQLAAFERVKVLQPGRRSQAA
jgi:hypothetical protein